LSEVFSSNGTSHISETEARLGDLMRDAFPHDETREGMSRAREMFLDWAKRNGIPFLSFWEYSETKRKNPGIHLAPNPLRLASEDHYLVFLRELALKVLTLGFLPD
jgi:hypothetical protein